MNRPRKHAAEMHAYADGADIQFRRAPFREWRDEPEPSWNDICEYRVKPAAPEYPVSTISDMTLSYAWVEAIHKARCMGPVFEGHIAKACADAGLRHACETQQVVPMAAVQEVARNLAKHSDDINSAMRDLKVAEAVRAACAKATNGSWGVGTNTACAIHARIYDTLLQPIIETVA